MPRPLPRGTPSNWEDVKKPCECGCGTSINAYGNRPCIQRRFVSGHNARKKPDPEIESWLQESGPLCACGCGRRVKRNLSQWKNRKVARYISGHNTPATGKDHYNWKGGTSPFRFRVEAHGIYNRWRRGILRRDSYACRQCGGTEHLEVAHLIPFAKLATLARKRIKAVLALHIYAIGLTLCRRCHRGKRH